MRNRRELFRKLAELLTYPGGDYLDRVRQCRRTAEEQWPSGADYLARLELRLQNLIEEELQELYCRTFDLNPVCALEVGWHLYGEDYRRGRLMVRIRELLRIHGVAERGELPDHLSHLLELMGKIPPEEGRELAMELLQPALSKMLPQLQKHSNPFVPLFEALSKLMEESSQTFAGVSHEH